MPPTGARPFDGDEGERAAELYERVFLGYGDDSIAQVGGAHVACEWVSNILTKVLQRGRLAAYLEQSTRYIPYDKPLPGRGGGYRYYRDERLGPEFGAAMDEIFSIYSRSLRAGRGVGGGALAARRRRTGGPLAALDPRQGARPAARPAAGGDAQPRRHLRLRPGLRAAAPAADGLAAARGARVRRHDPERAAAGDAELRLPGRAARPRRRVDRLPASSAARQTEQWVSRLGLDRRGAGEGTPSVELIHVDGTEEDLLASCLFESAATPETEILARLDVLDRDERAELLAAMVGERANRRHRPGRGFEALRYRFEIVSDYGAFRDLQRHRMLTCQWQRLGPDLGAGIPDEVGEAGAGDEFERALEISRSEYERLVAAGLPSRPPTRSASPTGSATRSTSTRARRCT